jgi:5'-nucleotidase
VARTVISRFADLQLPPDSLLNVNIPNLAYQALKGFRVAPVGKSRWVEEFDARTDPRGNDYYWMDGVLKLIDDTGDSDVAMLREGYVTLTPLQIDLTNHAAMDTVARWPIEL